MSSNRASKGSNNQRIIKKRVNSSYTKTRDNFRARDKPKYKSGNRPRSSTRDRGIENPKRRRPNNRSNTRTDYSSGRSSSDRRSSGSSDRRSSGSSDRRSSGSSDRRSSGRSGGRPSGRSDSRSGGRSGSRPSGGRSDSRSGGRSGSRPSYGSSDRPARRYDDRRSSGRSDSGPRQEFKAVCSACKKETTLPFKPSGSKPVYCRDCFQDHKPKDRDSDRPRRQSSDRPRRRESSDRPRQRYDDRRSSSRSDGGSRQEFKAVCSACKKETTLPFKPTGVKPVYCRDCFQDHKPRDGDSDRTRRRTTDRPRQRYDDRRSRDRSDRRTSSRQDFDAVCSACKTEMTLPFKPTGVKPVYCRSCFKKVEAGEVLTPKVEEKVERFGDREGPYRENKRMHKTHCRQCNELILVPFKPKKNKLIYCQDCYKKLEKES